MAYEISQERTLAREGATLLGVAAVAVVGVLYVAITVPTLEPLDEPHRAIDGDQATTRARVAPLDAGVDWSKVAVSEAAPTLSVAAYGQ